MSIQYKYCHNEILLQGNFNNLLLWSLSFVFFTQGIWSETEVLLLDRNHIEPEQLEDLPQMCNLITMDLSHNNLYQLQPFLATCLGNLRDLIINGNSLEYLPQEIFVTFSNLVHLKLARNRIEVIDKAALRGLRKLTDLDLSDNSLYSPNPGWFQDLEALEKLDLSHNNLHFIQSKVFRYLESLKSLDLSFNHIQHVYMHAFYGLSGLKQLLLNNNHITKIPSESLKIFKRIDLIDISNNHYKYLKTGNFDHVNVLHLKLNYNRYLCLVDNEAFSDMTYVQKLEIKDNVNLVYIDRNAFSNLDQLQLILISNNGLTSLDKTVISSMPNIDTLALGGNPWTCDCGLDWINSVFTSSDVTVVDRQLAICVKPHAKLGCVIPASAVDGNNHHQKCDNTSSSTPVENKSRFSPTTAGVTATSGTTQSPQSEQKTHPLSTSQDCIPMVVPMFESEIETYIGEEIQLDCRALGDPPPQIEWIISPYKVTDTIRVIKPGQSLPGDNRVSVHQSGSLHIEYVNHYDIGNYTCKVKNNNGVSSFNATLKIKNVLSHIIITRITDISVTLTWKTDIHVHGYQILYRQRASNSTKTYHKVDILPYMKYYTVSGLTPRTSYEFCIAVKHREKSLLISCNVTSTVSVGYTRTAVHDATGFIVGGTTVCLLAFVVLMCIGSHAVRMYNRKRRFPIEGQYGEDSDMFLAGLDSLSEMSPMTYENRFALMFDDSDIEEIQNSAAEASAALGLRTDTDL